VRAVTEGTSIEDALRLMARVKARRLVVTGRRERLLGILALDDVLELLVEEIESIGHILAAYGTKIPA
jgi:CBS domain-containing protein